MTKTKLGAIIAALVASGILGAGVLKKYCEVFPTDAVCPVVNPTPTPPTPPTPTPAPFTSCPKKFEGDAVYMRNNHYGQGVDSTVWISGDPRFCYMIHGVEVSRCHLEGWAKRSECEMELLGGCPVWQFRNAAFPEPQLCSDRSFEGPHMSCDHFGSVEFRDDPKTPAFEGQPAECGNQRDQYGPNAGFFMIAHGKGEVRACLPNFTGCGQWRAIDK
jgi:hypothetical protein